MHLVAANNVLTEIDDHQIIVETNIAKFKNFAKIYFQDKVKFEYNYQDYISNIARHYAYNLHDDVGEFFINLNIAPHFWISEAPVISNVEAILNDNSAGYVTVSSNYNEIKKFYSKWLYEKNDKQKQYYALSTINLIERNANSEHILKKILHANILVFDNRIYSPARSLELLNECEVLASNLATDEATKQKLLYLISLYAGIVSFKMEAFNDALVRFNSAMNYKPSGISAIYYMALTEKRLNNRKKCNELLGYVVEYDQLRFKYAFESNDLTLFRYFFNNCVTYNIFSELEFAEYLFDLELLIPYQNDENESIFGKLFDAKFSLNELYIEKYYNKEVKDRLEFLTKFMETYRQSKNMMLPFAHQFLKIKFNETLSMIDSLVKNHYQNLIAVELKLYDEQHFRNEEERNLRDDEANKIKEQYKKDMDNALKDNQEGYKIIIANLEKRIEWLSKDIKYDPKLSFNNTMVYNIIISVIVFVAGGFSEGMSEPSDSNFEVLSNIFYGGIKWGGITFLIGTIYALVSSISATWERTTRKNKLQKEINLRKKQRDLMNEAIKDEQSQKIKLYDTNHTKKISNLEMENEELRRDKTKKSNELSTRYVNLIEDIDKSLKKIVVH